MSEMKPDIDLGALARERVAPGVAPKKRRRLALVVPLALVLGFAAVLFSTLGDLLRGSVRVTVVRPQAAEATAMVAGSGELQRSGWVEPEPFAMLVPALAPGVVRELLVRESDAVEKDQPLAQLVDDEARLALAQAEAALARAQAEVAKAKVERELAQQSFDAALEVTEAETVARAELSGRTAEAERRAAAVREGEAQVRVVEEELTVQRYLSEQGGAGPRQVELAEARLAAQRAALAVLEAEVALAKAEVAKAEARLARAAKDRELRLVDRLRLETASAALTVAESAAREAQSGREQTALRLERMTVRAPAAGVVMQRLAGIGTQVGTSGDPALVTLYDPHSLRVRVDVEQSEVGKLVVGQAARIKSPLAPERFFAGEVERIVHFADVQKVTLQVHVKVREPDAALRPELLVEVHFLATPRGETATPSGSASASTSAEASSGASPGAVWIPRRVITQGQGGASVWIVDALSGRAALRRIDVVRDESERTLVRAGLDVSDKVIDEGRAALSDGARLSIASEGN